jgi:hypothetical protein
MVQSLYFIVSGIQWLATVTILCLYCSFTKKCDMLCTFASWGVWFLAARCMCGDSILSACSAIVLILSWLVVANYVDFLNVFLFLNRV